MDFDNASQMPLNESSDLFALKFVLQAALSKSEGDDYDTLRQALDGIFALGHTRGQVLSSLETLKSQVTPLKTK